MTELSAFGYRGGDNPIHNLDPRFKLLCVVLVGLAAFRATPPVLAGLTLLLAAAAGQARLRVGRALYELRYMAVLLVMVFAARAVSTPGEPMVRIGHVALTRAGIFQGGVVCWRLAVVALAGLLLTATTSGAGIRAGIAALLRPVPGVPHQRVATALGLFMRFLPMILTLAAETGDAQKARGVENRKNPLYRLPRFALPLMRRSLQRADRLALAMAARGYCEDRTEPVLTAGASDWLALAVCTLALAAAWAT